MSRNPTGIRIVGLPDWAESARFTVDANAVEGTSYTMMAGPMLQVLLEDRFRLKLHRESRILPVYDLVISKNGSKLQTTKEGGCVIFDPNFPPQPKTGEGAPHLCGDSSSRRTPDGAYVVDSYGWTSAQLSRFLGTTVDRPVLSKTGLGGQFDFRLNFALHEADAPTAPNIFSALEQQLGLKLLSAKGSVEFLVVDHLERPTGN